MHAFTKKQFNQFAESFLEEITSITDFNIKKLKFFESLAKSIGYNSHNSLLADLPLNIEGLSNNIADIEEELVSTFGIKINTHEVYQAWLAAFNKYSELPSTFFFDEQINVPINDISPFASIEAVTLEDEYSFVLTPLGVFVNDVVNAIFEQVEEGALTVELAQERFNEQLRPYKHNVYVRALWLNNLSPYIWQHDWVTVSPFAEKIVLDIDKIEDISTNAYSFAKDYVDEASKIATELLNIAGDKINNWCPAKIMLFSGIEHDQTTLIRSLYLAGVINLNVERLKRSRYFFTKHREVIDGFDVTHKYLGILAAKGHGGKVEDYVREDNRFLFMTLTMIELLREKKYEEAKSLFRKTLVHHLEAVTFSLIDMNDFTDYKHSVSTHNIDNAQEILHYAFTFEDDNDEGHYLEASNAPLDAVNHDDFFEKVLDYHYYFSNNVFGCIVNAPNEADRIIKKAEKMKNDLLAIC